MGVEKNTLYYIPAHRQLTQYVGYMCAKLGATKQQLLWATDNLAQPVIRRAPRKPGPGFEIALCHLGTVNCSLIPDWGWD